MTRLVLAIRRHPHAAAVALMAALVALAFVVVAATSLHREVLLGNIYHPGLQGEIAHQAHALHTLRHGDLLAPGESTFWGAPGGVVLSYAEAHSSHLWLTLPWTAWLGLVGGFNMSVLFLLLVNGFALVLLARALEMPPAVAVFVAVAGGLTSFVFLKAGSGFLQKICLYPIAAYVAVLAVGLRRRRLRWAVVAGGALFWVHFTYSPYALFLALGTAVVGGGTLLVLRSDWRWRLSFLMLSGAVFVVLLLAVDVSMGLSPLTVAGSAGSLGESAFALDPAHPFRFAPYHGEGFPFPAGATLGSSAIGFAVALVGALRAGLRARVALLAGLFFWGLGTRAGFEALVAVLPPAAGITFPLRLLPLADLGFAVAAGLGLVELAACVPSGARRLRGLVVPLATLGVALELLVVHSSVVPLGITPVDEPPSIASLASSDTSAVLFVPDVEDDMLTNLIGFYAALRELPLVNDRVRGKERRRSAAPEVTSESGWRHRVEGLKARGIDRVVLMTDRPFHFGGPWSVPPVPRFWTDSLCTRVDVFPGDAMAVCHLRGP